MAKKKMLEPLKLKPKRVRYGKTEKENKGFPSIRRVGAPRKPKGEIKDKNTGLSLEQKTWIAKEAKGRRLNRTEIIREAVDMYIASIESQRGDILEVNDIVNKDVVTQTKFK